MTSGISENHHRNCVRSTTGDFRFWNFSADVMPSVASASSDFPKFPLTARPNQQYSDLVPSRYEGRFAIVTSAGWDAVDADVPLTNGADAYGEVVWS
jgi:hypothetical protein